MYTENGIFIDSSNLVQGRFVKLTYCGSLYKQGAEEVYLHLGFGLLWEGQREIKMVRADDGFEAEIPLIQADSLNFCFRDNSNNWDNNSYQNYSYVVKRFESTKTTKLANTVETATYTENNSTIISPVTSSAFLESEGFGSVPTINLKETHTKAYGDISASVDLSQSLVPSFESEFAQFRRLPENYLRNKKMRIMLYRMFAYVPRLLNGYNRKKVKSMLKTRKPF